LKYCVEASYVLGGIYLAVCIDVVVHNPPLITIPS
jgi:hypothetical protein